ncbi:MAG: hypothetical protein KIT22_16795 [Verrucomicrobiae bacterium]|nr:hypothetical protein [Verrucomicrobiae bacterium]
MKKRVTYESRPSPPAILKEVADPLALAAGPDLSAMVRTQIYLTRAEHEFLLRESARRGIPMAAVIREYVDEKMRLPESAWADNPMLVPTPEDTAFQLPEDAAINHDHYLYGTPKKYVKRRGQWVLADEEGVKA